MWQDIEAEVDLLNHGVVAHAAAGLIRDANGAPLTVGISGGWGAGKSTLVKLIGAELRADNEACVNASNKKPAYILLEFNAWLYQGYEDARHALLDVVTDKLLEVAKENETKSQKVLAFVKRVRVLKTLKFLAPIATHVSTGTALGGPAGGLIGAVSGFLTATGNLADRKDELAAIKDAYDELHPDLKDLVEARKERSLPQEIQGLRDAFEKLLQELDITLVVLVDDLDRCLPDTAISTLEAMRLLLHVKRSAFIIAADENMIRGAVRAHFKGIEIEDGLVTSYFDKLIQVPLRVPRLGINEVKAYVVLLMAELAERKGSLSNTARTKGQRTILEKLKVSWNNGLTRDMLTDAFGEDAHKIATELDIADQLAPLLATSEEISGNPRLIKRFLNNLMLRQTMANAMGMALPFAEFVKVQLLERCGSVSAFEFLTKVIAASTDGKASFLDTLEKAAGKDEKYVPPDPSWDTPFYEHWVKLSPQLSDVDLRPLLHLSRDKALALAAYDELSAQAKQVLVAAMETDGQNHALVTRLKNLSETEASKVLVRLVRRARVDQWSEASIKRCFNIPEAFEQLGPQLAAALSEVPIERVTSPLLPELMSKAWAVQLLDKWKSDPKASMPVKNYFKTKK
jgi:predicted KAP-like P-loop ATPase